MAPATPDGPSNSSPHMPGRDDSAGTPASPAGAEPTGSAVPAGNQPISVTPIPGKPIPVSPTTGAAAGGGPQPAGADRPSGSKAVRPSRGAAERGRAAADRPTPAAATGPSAAAAERPSSAAAPVNRPIPIEAKADGGDLIDADDDDDAEDDPERELTHFLKAMPAWLFSSMVHMTLLIVLGLLVVQQNLKPKTEIAAQYAEELGEQLEDSSVTIPGTGGDMGKDTEQVITPKDLPPVDDPLAAPPIGEVALGGTMLTSNVEAPMIGLALSGRRAGSKEVLLRKYGGTRLTQSAVAKGLEWLVKQQQSDGTWSLSGPYSDPGGNENVDAATAMALLAFQGDGNTHREGKYAKQVAKAWDALLKRQHAEGEFFESGMFNHRLYTHAQCTIALCELYGMTHDSRFLEPAQRAIKYAVRIQAPQGGWRYTPGEDSDMSVTGWFVMALQSARMAKLDVPKETLDRVSQFLDLVAVDGGRKYDYQPNTGLTHALCAEGLLCREYLGWNQYDPRLIEGVGALNDYPVDYNSDSHDVYYWYYATQATHHMEGKIWDKWNRVMRQQIPAHQTQKGPEAGSWDPIGDRWGSLAGRLYTTCLSIYTLEVYYRHLPIYSGYRAFMPEAKSSEPQKPESQQPAAKEGEEKPAED